MIILKGNQIMSLNPFEVREVLQVMASGKVLLIRVSIPLKSGRCCKTNTATGGTYTTSQSL